MPDTTIDDICSEFQHFIASHRTGTYSESEYIEAYIFDWAFTGDYEGVIAVNGDYELFLQVVIAIIARCLSDPHFLDYIDPEIHGPRPRPVLGVADPDIERDRLVFISKHVFQGVVFDLMTKGQ